jgi:pyruvate kinase
MSAAHRTAPHRTVGPPQIDFVSISYCRSGADVREVRQFVEAIPALATVALIAKVETRQALFNFRVGAVDVPYKASGAGAGRGRQS